jgi:hypothetical protein
MSTVDVPLAQIRIELEKLGFRDLPEHLLVSFMQSIVSEESDAAAMSGASFNAPSSIVEPHDGTFLLRSNGAISTQAAPATLASAALKTRVSGRKVTILSPSKSTQPSSQIANAKNDQVDAPRQPSQRNDADLHEPRPTMASSEQRRPSTDIACQSSAKNYYTLQRQSDEDRIVVHSIPSAHVPQFEAAARAARAPTPVISDENSVPESQRLEAANIALRAAISSKSSALKAHSSSSSVIFVSAAPSRPRSRHDPVKAFQNHVMWLFCTLHSILVLLSHSPLPLHQQSAEWASTPHSRLSYAGPAVAQRSTVVQPLQPSLPLATYDVQPHVTPRSRPTLPSR